MPGGTGASSEAANGLPNGHSTELAGQGALGAMRQRVARPPPTAEEALKHLLLTVDVERLYRQASGGSAHHPAACKLLLHEDQVLQRCTKPFIGECLTI